jgi:hypothetical protein
MFGKSYAQAIGGSSITPILNPTIYTISLKLLRYTLNQIINQNLYIYVYMYMHFLLLIYVCRVSFCVVSGIRQCMFLFSWDYSCSLKYECSISACIRKSLCLGRGICLVSLPYINILVIRLCWPTSVRNIVFVFISFLSAAWSGIQIFVSIGCIVGSNLNFGFLFGFSYLR